MAERKQPSTRHYAALQGEQLLSLSQVQTRHRREEGKRNVHDVIAIVHEPESSHDHDTYLSVRSRTPSPPPPPPPHKDEQALEYPLPPPPFHSTIREQEDMDRSRVKTIKRYNAISDLSVELLLNPDGDVRKIPLSSYLLQEEKFALRDQLDMLQKGNSAKWSQIITALKSARNPSVQADLQSQLSELTRQIKEIDSEKQQLAAEIQELQRSVRVNSTSDGEDGDSENTFSSSDFVKNTNAISFSNVHIQPDAEKLKEESIFVPTAHGTRVNMKVEKIVLPTTDKTPSRVRTFLDSARKTLVEEHEDQVIVIPEKIQRVIGAIHSLHNNLEVMQTQMRETYQAVQHYVSEVQVQRYMQIYERFMDRLKIVYDYRDLEANVRQRQIINEQIQEFEMATHDFFLAEFKNRMESDIERKKEAKTQRQQTQPAPSMVVKKKAPSIEGIKIKLDVFSGDLTTWKGFQDKFMEFVHLNEELTDTLKAEILLQHLEGSPKMLFSSFKASDRSYHQLKEAVWAKYDRPEMIKTALYDKLEGLVPKSQNITHAVAYLHQVENLKDQIESLSGSTIAFGLAARKVLAKNLSQELKNTIALNSKVKFNEDSFEDILQGSLDSLECLEAAQPLDGEVISPGDRTIMGAAVSTYEKNKRQECLFCPHTTKHSTESCPKSAEDKLKFFTSNKRCFGCGTQFEENQKYQVHRAVCNKAFRCGHCKSFHLESLCQTIHKYYDDKKKKKYGNATGPAQQKKGNSNQPKKNNATQNPQQKTNKTTAAPISTTHQESSKSSTAQQHSQKGQRINDYSVEELNNLMRSSTENHEHYVVNPIISASVASDALKSFVPIVDMGGYFGLLDSGAMENFITTKRARELNVEILGSVQMTISTFGNCEAVTIQRPLCKLPLPNGESITAVVTDTVLADVDTQHYQEHFPKMKTKTSIDVILGAKALPLVVKSAQKVHSQLLKYDTLFGQVFSGLGPITLPNEKKH